MSYAKYYEDNLEIAEDRWYYRSRRYEEQWNIEKERLESTTDIKIIEPDEDLLVNRTIELIEIRDSISCKTNLAYSVKNSIENPSMSHIVESMIHDLEDSYTRVSRSIRLIGNKIANNNNTAVDIIGNKKLLVQVLIYKAINSVQNVSVIDRGEMDDIRKDILKLITWYYDETKQYGRFSELLKDEKKISSFMVDTMGYELTECPYCNNKTIRGLKYCLNCAEEM